MSWLWRDELRLLLTPQRVFLQRRARGVRPAVVEHGERGVSGGDGFHWAGAVEALGALLAERPRRAADAVVVVSNHFARYTLVPASDLLVTHDDELRFARLDLARVYGPAAEHWNVSVSADGHGRTMLASGIPGELVDAVRAVLKAHGLRPKSLQPALVAAFNASRNALPAGDARLVCIEPGMAVCALLQPGWRRIRSQRLTGMDEVESLVQRERAMDDAAPAAEAVCILPVIDVALPPALADGTPLSVLPPLWTAPPMRTETAGEQAA